VSLQPWMSPDDTVEAIEILQEVEDFLSNTAMFGSLRKQLRTNLDNKAVMMREFRSRVKQGVIDTSLILAIEDLARKRQVSNGFIIREALEQYISKENRRK